jgi:hypothetical protein
MADDPKPQLDKFKDLARELEADEDEKAFEDQVRRISKKPPEAGSPDPQEPPAPDQGPRR